jgi:hypothetical protein
LERISALADKTAEFLIKNARLDNGSCVFLTDREGNKKLFGDAFDLSTYVDCFVILGTSEYAAYKKDSHVLEFSLDLYRNTKKKFTDGAFRTDPDPTPKGYITHGVSMILTNTARNLADAMAEMREFMKTMKDEYAESKRKARAESLIAEAHKVMEKNGCTNAFIRNITLKGVEVGEADTAESIAEKCKTIYDQNCKDAFGEGYTPPRGNGSGQDKVDYASMVEALKESGDLS